jgi:hypothetical protein
MMSGHERSAFALPKAHLHALLILSARQATMCELADRYGVLLRDAWVCGSLSELIERAPIAFGLIRTPDELRGDDAVEGSLVFAREARLLNPT